MKEARYLMLDGELLSFIVWKSVVRAAILIQAKALREI